MSYEGDERRGDLRAIRETLYSMQKPQALVDNNKGWQFNKSVPLAFVLSLLIIGGGAFKSITLSFADIDTNAEDITKLKSTLVTQGSVDNLIFKQNIEMGAVVSSIDDLKITQDKFSVKLENLTDIQQENYNKLSATQQRNYNSLRDYILKMQIK